MKKHPFVAIIFCCLLVTSLMVPADALTGSLGDQNRSVGSPNPGSWYDSDGRWYEISVDENNTVHCIGLNNKGQCDIPRGLGDVQSVDAGSAFAVARMSNGSVVVWGSNDHGQRNVPPNLANVVQTAVTSDSVAVRLENGTVLAWGNNDKGQTDVPSILVNDVANIVAGNSYFVALTREGNVVAWGDNNLGQCDIPRGMGKIIDIAAGPYHSLALAENGTVFSWGWNRWGLCDIPPDIGKVSNISIELDHSYIHLENGTDLLFGSYSSPTHASLPGKYSSINETNFKSLNHMERENIAVSIRGDLFIWTVPYEDLNILISDKKSDILYYVPNQGIFNLKRVCDKDLLDHHSRSSIYEKIHDNPGIHFNDLCRTLEINRGTMSYHLALLLSSGKVIGMEYAGKMVYFSNKGCFGDTERKLLVHLKNPTRRKLLENLHTHGHLRRADLIDYADLSTAAAAWHLKFLSDEGIVQSIKSGREAYYSIHPEMGPYLSGLMAAVSE